LKVLFRFNIATERVTGSIENAVGLGHARRCISLAKELIRSYGCDILFLVEGTDDAGRCLEDCGIPFMMNCCDEDVIRRFRPDIIVADINHLAPETVKQFKAWAPVVNLAPRGLTKYYADITINDTSVIDCPPADPPSAEYIWYRGPEYAIVADEFIRERELIDPERNNACRTITLLAGGVDECNMTSAVLHKLKQWDEKVRLNVVLGRLNPHKADINMLCKELKIETCLYIEPANLARIISSSLLGIFGTGITVFEGLCVGVPSINLGCSRFHDLRGRELESHDVIKYLGRYDQIKGDVFLETLQSLISDLNTINRMRSNGLRLITPKAAKTIADIICKRAFNRLS
jgi:spore coat polysaccharide biosynthesis predicted glycosyltransferase SpsG